MRVSLKTNYLFIGHQLTLNEICQEQNLDLKSDKSVSDLTKSLKEYEMIFKISALKKKKIFL